MPNFDFLSDSGAGGAQRLPGTGATVPQRRPAAAAPSRPSVPLASRRSPNADSKALLLLAGVLTFCGYLYLVAIGLCAVGAVACALQNQPTPVGLCLGGMVACAIQALFCFAAAGFIKLAIRGVQAMEDTAGILRAMQR